MNEDPVTWGKHEIVEGLVFTGATIAVLFTVNLFIDWTVTGVAWWLRDLAALALFFEGGAFAVWSLVVTGRLSKWPIVVWLNRVLLNRYGLHLVGAQKLCELEHVWCEWPYVMARLQELEAAEEERALADEVEA